VAPAILNDYLKNSNQKLNTQSDLKLQIHAETPHTSIKLRNESNIHENI
jgi:hypothetical protein